MTVSELLPDDARILGSYTMVGREPASRADYTDADWLMESRRLLLQSEEVRRRLRADDRLEQLVMDLDGHFGLWELQNAAANLRSGRARRSDRAVGPGMRAPGRRFAADMTGVVVLVVALVAAPVDFLKLRIKWLWLMLQILASSSMLG